MATAPWCVNVYGEGGLVLEKPYDWSPQTEVVSIREFSQQTQHGQWETGFNEYFIDPNGKRFSVERSKIAKIIFYPDVGEGTDIRDQAELSPIAARLRELESIRAKYRVTTPYLDRQIAKLQREVSLFEQGARKIAGTWVSAEEIARQKREAAEREAKLEADRKAEEERQAAIRAEEERLAAERKAAAQAALAKQVAEFKKDSADLLASTSLPASDFQELRTFKDVKELPAATEKKISALDEKVRSLRDKDDAERLAEACRAEIVAVGALLTRSKAAQEIRANNAAAALADVSSFLQDNPSPPSGAHDDLWKSLTSIRSLCSRLQREAETYIEKAQSLSASGKAGDAIQAFQTANRIFPDPKVADAIKQLRESRLGL